MKISNKKMDCGGPKAKFCRERQFPPSWCTKGTFRVTGTGETHIVVCRVKKQYRKRLHVGRRGGQTAAQSILRRKTAALVRRAR